MTKVCDFNHKKPFGPCAIFTSASVGEGPFRSKVGLVENRNNSGGLRELLLF